MKIYLLNIVLLFLVGCSYPSKKYYQPPPINDKTFVFSSKEDKWEKLNNQERIGDFTRIDSVIFCGEIYCDVDPMKNVDVNTFQVIPRANYAKDKNFVYYPISLSCIDYFDCGVCYCDEYVIKNANPNSFKYLGKDYATDEDLVFFRGKLLKEADGKTFEVIEGGGPYSCFAKDKNHVYKREEIFPVADAASFYVDKDDPRNIFKIIIGDKDHEWEFQPPDKFIILKEKNKQ